jgi:hypothetical protein
LRERRGVAGKRADIFKPTLGLMSDGVSKLRNKRASSFETVVRCTQKQSNDAAIVDLSDWTVALMHATVPRYLRQCRSWWCAVGIVIAGASIALPAGAAELSDLPTPSAVDIHAFVSQGYIKSTGNDYLVSSTGAGSFDFSEAGINFTAQLTEKFRVGIQLFAYEQGKLGQYATSADWYYLDYHLRDTFGIRAGRLKMPLGFYGDIADIDAARVPILLPSGVYPAVNRDLLLSQTGGEIYGYFRGRLGALDYRAFGGSLQVVLPSQAGSLNQISDYAVPYVGGGRLLWEAPFDGLRVGLTGLALRAKATEVLLSLWPGAGTPAPTVNLSENLYMWIGSIEYVVHDLLVQAEFTQSRGEISTDNQPANTVVSEAGYGLLAYRVRRWLEPGAYYSLAFYNRNLGAEQDDRNVQHDLAATLRFDLNSFWIVKVEGHFMHGTELINAASTQDVLTNPVNWGVFLVKTTGYF